MHEQGGRIEVNSVRGKGATFTLRFQMKKEESHAEPFAVGR
jgi:signal transduction histidine kinase